MKYKQRINAIKTETGRYSGYLVNLPMCIAEGDTIEELKCRLKMTAITALEHFMKDLEEDEPFEVKEFASIAEWITPNPSQK